MRSPQRITLLILGLSLASLAACSDDSEATPTTTTTASPEQAYCADADQLDSDLTALGALELPGDGTDAVKGQVDTIKSDLSTLKASAGDVAATEISALEASVDELESAVSDVSGDLTVSNTANVVVAIESVAATGREVVSTLQTACS